MTLPDNWPYTWSWWPQQLIGVTAVLLWLAALASVAVQLRRRTDNPGMTASREWSRKVVHIGTGAVVPIAWLFGIDRMIAIPAAAAITVAAAVNHRMRLLPAIEDVGRHSYGTVFYGASITLLLWVFWPQHSDAVCAGVLVMALGDGLAGVIGRWIPSPHWTVFGHRKSVLGTAVMATTSMIVLSLLAVVAAASHTATSNNLPAPATGSLISIALLATLLEQLAWLGLDNLTVPIVSAWLWASWR